MEIPHSCSLAVAPYVILLSDPQKTLKLHDHADLVSIAVIQTCVQQTYWVHSEPTDVLLLLTIWLIWNIVDSPLVLTMQLCSDAWCRQCISLTFRVTKHSAWFYFGKPLWGLCLYLVEILPKAGQISWQSHAIQQGWTENNALDKWITYLVGTHKGCVLKLGNWQALCLY